MSTTHRRSRHAPARTKPRKSSVLRPKRGPKTQPVVSSGMFLKAPRGFSPRKNKFIAEYLVDLNAQAAARRAGYTPLKDGTCHHGSDLLKEPYIAQCVKEALDRRQTRVEVKQDDVLREAMRLGYSDLRKAFNRDGTMKPVHEWPDDVASFISSVKISEIYGRGKGRPVIGQLKEIKLWSKVSALELLAKHLGILIEKHEIHGKDGGPVEVQILKIGDKEIKF